MIRRTASRRLATGAAALIALATSAAALAVPQTASASGGADVCAGGDWSLVLPGRTVNPAPGVDLKTTIPAAQLGTSFLVKGRYIEFTGQLGQLRRHELDPHRKAPTPVT